MSEKGRKLVFALMLVLGAGPTPSFFVAAQGAEPVGVASTGALDLATGFTQNNDVHVAINTAAAPVCESVSCYGYISIASLWDAGGNELLRLEADSLVGYSRIHLPNGSYVLVSTWPWEFDDETRIDVTLSSDQYTVSVNQRFTATVPSAVPGAVPVRLTGGNGTWPAYSSVRFATTGALLNDVFTLPLAENGWTVEKGTNGNATSHAFYFSGQPTRGVLRVVSTASPGQAAFIFRPAEGMGDEYFAEISLRGPQVATELPVLTAYSEDGSTAWSLTTIGLLNQLTLLRLYGADGIGRPIGAFQGDRSPLGWNWIRVGLFVSETAGTIEPHVGGESVTGPLELPMGSGLASLAVGDVDAELGGTGPKASAPVLIGVDWSAALYDDVWVQDGWDVADVSP